MQMNNIFLIAVGIVAIIAPLVLLYLLFFTGSAQLASLFDYVVAVTEVTLGAFLLWLGYVINKMLKKS
jgi:hypothetical protein